MTTTFTASSNPKETSSSPEENADTHSGNADSRKLAKDWVQGKGNTKDENFVTPSDEADPRTVEEVIREKGMGPGFSGDKK